LELGERELKVGAASRRAIAAADCHPLSARRFAPAIERLQRTCVPASTLAVPHDADPQRRYMA